jgi:predicted MPP superfamily phosphohydrolase
MAGLDDIGRARRGGRDVNAGLERTLPKPLDGATILLSHIPDPGLIERAAQKDIDLMLSGHTHGGQVWWSAAAPAAGGRACGSGSRARLSS